MSRCASPARDHDARRPHLQGRHARRDRVRSRGPGDLSGGRPCVGADEIHPEVPTCTSIYGESHAIQGISLTLERGILPIVGRNGMGKTTLCNAITRVSETRSGSVVLAGREVPRPRPAPDRPAGRRLRPAGAARLAQPFRRRAPAARLRARGRDAAWTVERVYATFPRLAERRGNGGADLSGGEQQMLAISRALLGNRVLVVGRRDRASGSDGAAAQPTTDKRPGGGQRHG